jgi:hypothetical protein
MASVPERLKELTPAPASALIAGLGLTTANTKANTSASPLSTYNPRKDVSGSTAAALSAMSPKFWGASNGGSTTCHTTFVPDLILPGSSSASSASSPSSAYASPMSTASTSSSYNFPRANLNPLLNDKKPVEVSSPPASTSPLGHQTDGSDLSDSFDNWSVDNGFTWNNLDAYRMQLWSRMARDASLARQGVPTDMRPKFLRESSLGHQHHKTSMSVNEALSPVPHTGSAPPTYRESHDDPTPSITQIIQHTISTSLFSSFLNALKSPNPAKAGRFDSEKIADIVQGRAAMGVVPTEPPAYTEKQTKNTLDVDAELALAMSLNNLKLATENIARSKSQDVAARRVGAAA